MGAAPVRGLSDGGGFHCTNRWVVDDEEMRGVARSDVKAAISRVRPEAAAEAMREVESQRGR